MFSSQQVSTRYLFQMSERNVNFLLDKVIDNLPCIATNNPYSFLRPWSGRRKDDDLVQLAHLFQEFENIGSEA